MKSLVLDLCESVRESFYCGVEGSLAVKQAGRGNCESYLVHGWFLLGWRDDGRDVFERLSSLKCSVSNDQSAVCLLNWRRRQSSVERKSQFRVL